MAPTLEQQLDALIAEHGLHSLSIGRVRRADGSAYWIGSAHAKPGYCSLATNDAPTASGTIAHLISGIHAQRTPAVVVPELEFAA